jgi:hypothetical protein
MATNTSSSDAREKAGGAGEQTQPKRGLRGSLASAGERVRRAIAGGREKAEVASEAPAAVTGTHPVTVAAEGDAGRASVRALARSLLHQDRTGAPLEPVEAASLEMDEPKTTPRAKSVPPPLPKQRADEELAPLAAPEASRQNQVTAEVLKLAGESAVASAPRVGRKAPPLVVPPPAGKPKATVEVAAPSSRSAQLRARLAAAKAQHAEAQARLAEPAMVVAASATAAEEEPQSAALADEIESADGFLEELESSDALSAQSSPELAESESDSADSSVDDLEEFEDLEAAALVEEPSAAHETAP